ncbi:MAG TPA: VOC family protein [Methyloceanibacter sp.]|nr:VOC family protein [Methyloceanibacter sp.]
MASQADHRRWLLDPACAGMTKGLSKSPNVTLITLGVADVAKATAFYEQLGFKKSKRASEASVSFFKSGGVVLALWSPRHNARMRRPARFGTAMAPSVLRKMSQARPRSMR